MSSRGNILFDYVYYLFFNKKYTILKNVYANLY